MQTSNRFLFFTTAIIIVATVVYFSCFSFLNVESRTNQHPTQDEWLEVYTSNEIRKITDLWQQRVAINVTVFSQDADTKPLTLKEMVITMTSANGQDPITTGIGRDQYTKTAENTAKSILENYGVTKEYKLSVQFID